jgi:cytochrome c
MISFDIEELALKDVLVILSAIGMGLAVSIQAHAEGNPIAGEGFFRSQCLGCHEHDSQRNALGASLVGVINRKAGTLPGATFSRALTESNITWDEASLDRFLASPSILLPMTLMTAHEISVANERADIIAYLKTLR